jgi:AAT family amino acid transporter
LSSSILLTLALPSILLFYVLSILLIGLDGQSTFVHRLSELTDVHLLVPYTYPNLSTKSSTTSPFTIIFSQVGSSSYLH